jgi:hypothetical protein
VNVSWLSINLHAFDSFFIWLILGETLFYVSEGTGWFHYTASISNSLVLINFV